jgi:hypothetical protein
MPAMSARPHKQGATFGRDDSPRKGNPSATSAFILTAGEGDTRRNTYSRSCSISCLM